MRTVNVNDIVTIGDQPRQDFLGAAVANANAILESGSTNIVLKELIDLFVLGGPVHLPVNMPSVSLGIEIGNPRIDAGDLAFQPQVSESCAEGNRRSPRPRPNFEDFQAAGPKFCGSFDQRLEVPMPFRRALKGTKRRPK